MLLPCSLSLASATLASLAWLMGCSSGKATEMPPFQPQRSKSGKSAHGFNLPLPEFDPEKLEDPQSSWKLQAVPEGYPRDKLLPPDRELHQRHLKKLNRFLKQTEEDPIQLGESRPKSRHRFLLSFAQAQIYTCSQRPSRINMSIRTCCI